MFRKEKDYRVSGESGGHRTKAVHAPEGAIAPGRLTAQKLQWWENPQVMRQIAEGVVFIFLVLIVGIFGSRLYSGTTETARRRVCVGNLRQIAMALQMYTNDYDGLMPPGEGDFARQTLRYLHGVRYLICPSDDLSTRPPAPRRQHMVAISYTYQAPPGLNLDSLPDPTSFPMVWDRIGGIAIGAHRDGGNVLYADGHARWRPMRRWATGDRPE